MAKSIVYLNMRNNDVEKKKRILYNNTVNLLKGM